MSTISQVIPGSASLAQIIILALTAAVEGATRRKRTEPRPEPKQVVQEQDEYKSCDVAVREFVREEKKLRRFR
jgi:hypothetical protein